MNPPGVRTTTPRGAPLRGRFAVGSTLATPATGPQRPTPAPPAVGPARVEDATPLPIYAEAVGSLKAIGYVEEGRLDAAQVERVRRMGNATDGKYVWNVDALDRLLRANAHLVAGTVDDFVRVVRSRQPIDSPSLLCLIHVAFLDHRSYVAQPCAGSTLVLPPAVAAYMDAVLAYGADLVPEDAWVVPLVAAPTQWPRLFGLLNGLQRQADDCRRALYGRSTAV